MSDGYGSKIVHIRQKEKGEKVQCGFCGAYDIAQIDHFGTSRTFMCRECSDGYTIVSDPNPFPWLSALISVALLALAYLLFLR